MDLRGGIDRADVPGVVQTPRMLVQVYDGGAIPTTVPRVYLTHPAWADSADTEGATPSYSADTSVTIPVVVLGPTAPAAGDLLMAHAIGGRWVAGEGGGGVETYTCSPCSIPERDLSLSWAGNEGVTGSTTLVWNGVNTWLSACIVCTGEPQHARERPVDPVFGVQSDHRERQSRGALADVR